MEPLTRDLLQAAGLILGPLEGPLTGYGWDLLPTALAYLPGPLLHRRWDLRMAGTLALGVPSYVGVVVAMMGWGTLSVLSLVEWLVLIALPLAYVGLLLRLPQEARTAELETARDRLGRAGAGVREHGFSSAWRARQASK
ncbi:hypothetical protein [Belnapia sp. F-4-1]|uniref:hypothetical protein n=1 Tax=Belnapia sp. F-4-1 TaxID=1545443 RepID=UPI0005B78D65|nr:hypothetical protein [Belnapia sp. F-4-1]